jgi:hypothetical protein
VRRGALLADFLLLFLEACLFFVTARLLADPRAASWALVTLLALDALWAGAAQLIFVTTPTRWAELQWVFINLIAAPILALALLITSGSEDAAGMSVAILCVGCVVRTAVDYWRSWDLYFPP